MSSLYPPSARPAEICGALLAALEAAEGRRRSRKRDQTPDGIGLAIKRDILKRTVEDGKAIYAYDKAKGVELRPTTEYFMSAVEAVKENKERYAEAEAQAALRPKFPT